MRLLQSDLSQATCCRFDSLIEYLTRTSGLCTCVLFFLMKPENSKKQLKKSITSSELVAASSTTRVTEWAPHGTKTDLGFMSRSLEWTLFFFSFIFAPLSSDYPLLSSQQMLSCSSLFRLTIESFFFQSCLCLNPKEEEYGATSETSIIPH